MSGLNRTKPEKTGFIQFYPFARKKQVFSGQNPTVTGNITVLQNSLFLPLLLSHRINKVPAFKIVSTNHDKTGFVMNHELLNSVLNIANNENDAIIDVRFTKYMSDLLQP